MLGIFFILVILYGVGIHKINTQFKQVKIKEIPFGVEHEIMDGVQMKVNGFTRMDKEEVYQTYGYKSDYEGEIKAFLVDVTYINENEDTQMIATYNSNIERVGYSNGIEPILYSLCNPFGLEFELKSGEKKDVILTYIVMDFQFRDKKWKEIDKENFFITTSRYPVKTNWLLQ